MADTTMVLAQLIQDTQRKYGFNMIGAIRQIKRDLQQILHYTQAIENGESPDFTPYQLIEAAKMLSGGLSK